MPCAGNVPVIVASGSIDQSSGGNLAATAVFTPSAAGIYRLSVYIDRLGGGNGFASWTDDVGSVGDINLSQIGSSTQIGSYTFTAAASAPIEVGVSSNSSSSPYTISYVVEQLA